MHNADPNRPDKAGGVALAKAASMQGRVAQRLIAAKADPALVRHGPPG